MILGISRTSIFIASLVFSTLIILPTANAKLFRNSYLSFELPPNWKCKNHNTEWVCTSQFEKGAKSAVIILTAKEKGPSDSFASYNATLKIPRPLKLKSGKTQKSKIIHAGDRKIANHQWVDGLHLGSEIGPYYTRYLATIKDKLAILVTFSAHKKVYTKYSNDFLKAIQSLRVVAPKDILTTRPKNIRPSSGNIGTPIGTAMPIDMAVDIDGLPEEGSDSSKSSGLGNKLLGLALLIGAIAAYLYFRSRKGTKKKSSSKKRRR